MSRSPVAPKQPATEAKFPEYEENTSPSPSPSKSTQSLTQAQHRSLGTWVFGSLLLLFVMGVFIFAPPSLPEFKHRLLAIITALLAGFFAFFLTGDIGIEIKSLKSRFGEIGLRAAGGLALFVAVLIWWSSPLAPVSEITEIPEIHEQTLSGSIRDENGDPLAGVQVSLPEFGESIATDTLGRFSFQVEASHQATVTLIAQKADYRTDESYATLGDNHLSFTLRKKE